MINTMSTSIQQEPTAKKPLSISREQALVIWKKLHWGRIVTLACYGGLILLFTLLNVLRETGNVKIWLMQIIPLLIFIPGLIRETHRTYSWLCFVTLIYFVAITPVLMARGLWSDWLIMLLSCTLFIAAMMTSRWLQYWNYYLANKDQPVT